MKRLVVIFNYKEQSKITISFLFLELHFCHEMAKSVLESASAVTLRNSYVKLNVARARGRTCWKMVILTEALSSQPFPSNGVASEWPIRWFSAESARKKQKLVGWATTPGAQYSSLQLFFIVHHLRNLSCVSFYTPVSRFLVLPFFRPSHHYAWAFLRIYEVSQTRRLRLLCMIPCYPM